MNYSSPGTLVSNSIIIRAGAIYGPIVFTINKAISINAPQGTSSHKTTETVLIPAHVTYRVRKLNMSRVVITHTFSAPLPEIYGYQYIIRLRIINPQVNNNDFPTLLYDPNIAKPKLKPKTTEYE